MATKMFDHAVIYDGVFYPANTPIKIKDEPKDDKPTAKKAVTNRDKGTSN